MQWWAWRLSLPLWVASTAAVMDREPGAEVACELEIKWPRHGQRVAPSFVPTFTLMAPDAAKFMEMHGTSSHVCFALDDLPPQCVELSSAEAVVENAPLGTHRLQAWVAQHVTGRELSPIDEITLEVMSKSDVAALPPGPSSLLQWYQGLDQSQDELPATPTPQARGCDKSQKLLLLVGIKTTVGHFEERQALRETWLGAGKATPEVCVWFAVGEPPLEGEEASLLRLALEAEQLRYGDLLTGSNGLVVQDSYTSLVEKTTGLMSFACEHYDFEYLLMSDDDIYLQLDKLLGALREESTPKEGFYAGQVWSHRYSRAVKPQRALQHKNHLSELQWPLSELLPFAIGPHYLLSKDCVEFVASNRHQLKPVGTLEDVSIGLWMLALQVHPLDVAAFQNAKDDGCSGTAVSLSDLSSFGVRALHANLIEGRPACFGYSEEAWIRGWGQR
ncbi:unnamed protein product [Chrysoparadoxa australica]